MDSRNKRHVARHLILLASFATVVVCCIEADAKTPAHVPMPLTPEQERLLKPLNQFKECTDCPMMVVIPAGSFTMGSPDTEPARTANEGPRHTVSIGRPFAVSKHPVTTAEWRACVARKGCQADRDDSWKANMPVTGTDYDDAQDYVRWLSSTTGKSYRLLSEAEYEYAARAGSGTAYPWGNNVGKGNAHCQNCGSPRSLKSPSPIGSFKPNAFGLHDMAGNVQSYTLDCANETYVDAPTDGSAWTTGDCRARMVRGGSWASNADSVRSSVRQGVIGRYPELGIRVARTLE